MEVLYFLQWYWRPGTVVMYSVWKARLIQRVDCRRENAGKWLNGCHSDAHASSFKSRPGEGVIETMTRPKKKRKKKQFHKALFTFVTDTKRIASRFAMDFFWAQQ